MHRTSFWHSVPNKKSSRGTDPQETRASTRTGLPPIELHPSISFEETFIRGNNFGKPVKSNIAVQAIPKDIRNAAVEIDTSRGAGAGKQNYLKALVADLQNDVRMKDEELEHVTELCDSTKEKLQQSERKVRELESAACKVTELKSEIMVKEKIIMEQTNSIQQMKTAHADTINRMLKESEKKIEEAKASQMDHMEYKQTKINNVKEEISDMINQSSHERGEQLRDLQQSLIESKKECRRLQKLVNHYKDSCPSCHELRKEIEEKNEEIITLKQSETDLKKEVELLKNKLSFQTELKVNEMEKMRSLHEIEIRSRETAIRQLKTEVVSTWDAKAAERVGEMRKMERLVNTLQNENSSLNEELTRVKQNLEASTNKISKLESKLFHVKEQKVKLADLLVSSQEDAQNMQMEYEAQLDELYQRLEEQLEEEQREEDSRTPTSQNAEPPQDSMLQSYRAEEDEEHMSQNMERSYWSTSTANQNKASGEKRRQPSFQSSMTGRRSRTTASKGEKL